MFDLSLPWSRFLPALGPVLSLRVLAAVMFRHQVRAHAVLYDKFIITTCLWPCMHHQAVTPETHAFKHFKERHAPPQSGGLINLIGGHSAGSACPTKDLISVGADAVCGGDARRLEADATPNIQQQPQRRRRPCWRL